MSSINWQPANAKQVKSPVSKIGKEEPQSNIWFGMSFLLMGLIAGVILAKYWLG